MSHDQPIYIGSTYPVQESHTVDLIRSAEVTDDGRSEWLWLRLANGDLMLGCFPRGATYEETEVAWSDDWQAATINYTEKRLAADWESQGFDLAKGHLYEKCLHCHLFVEYNDAKRSPNDDIANYLHLTRGDAADERFEDHNAEPSGLIATLDVWRIFGPTAMRERFVTKDIAVPPPLKLDDLTDRLSIRHYNVLRREGIESVNQLLRLSPNDLLEFRNIGNIEPILDLQNELRATT